MGGSILTFIPLLDHALTHSLILLPWKSPSLFLSPVKVKEGRKNNIVPFYWNSCQWPQGIRLIIILSFYENFSFYIHTFYRCRRTIFRLYLKRIRCVQVTFIAWQTSYSCNDCIYVLCLGRDYFPWNCRLNTIYFFFP